MGGNEPTPAMVAGTVDVTAGVDDPDEQAVAVSATNNTKARRTITRWWAAAHATRRGSR